MHERATFLVAFFKELRVLRIKLDPRSLDNKHIKIMVARWVERGLKAATIQTYLSFLRVFAYWIGKAGLVLQPEFYVADPTLVKRTYVAKQDKSWCTNGVDADEKIAEIATYSEHASVQLDVGSAFGLRMKEVLMMQPRLAVVPAEKDNLLQLEFLYRFFENPPAQLDQIKPKHIRQFLDWRGKASKTQANREKALFSHIWNKAREWGYTEFTNPCAGIKGFRERARKTYAFDEDSSVSIRAPASPCATSWIFYTLPASAQPMCSRSRATTSRTACCSFTGKDRDADPHDRER